MRSGAAGGQVLGLRRGGVDRGSSESGSDDKRRRNRRRGALEKKNLHERAFLPK